MGLVIGGIMMHIRQSGMLHVQQQNWMSEAWQHCVYKWLVKFREKSSEFCVNICRKWFLLPGVELENIMAMVLKSDYTWKAFLKKCLGPILKTIKSQSLGGAILLWKKLNSKVKRLLMWYLYISPLDYIFKSLLYFCHIYPSLHPSSNSFCLWCILI